MVGKLEEAAKRNPTALGDPVSLKAETEDSAPTQHDRPSKGNGSNQNKGQGSLKEVAERDLNEAKKGNRSMLGDPVSLKAETSDRDPVEEEGMGSVTGNMGRDSKI